MQPLILLLTSFLLGCGIPAFLIGFYSIRIWESHLRSFSVSFVGSDSGCDRAKSKHKKSCKDRSKDQRKETGGDRPGREKASSPTFSSSKRMVTRSILEPTSTPVDVLSPSGQTISVSVEGVPPSTTSNAISPLARGRTDPAASVPDCGQTPLPIPDCFG
jgi:hypothetical protein